MNNQSAQPQKIRKTPDAVHTGMKLPPVDTESTKVSKDLGVQEAAGSNRGRQKIETAFLESANFKKLVSTFLHPFRLTPSGILFQKPVPTIEQGSGAPSSTPAQVGDIYVDISGAKLYMASGIASSGDWSLLN